MSDLRIYKYPLYPLGVVGDVGIEMPIGADILTVQIQDETPCIWAIVDPSRETELRHFRLFGTGHPIDTETALSHYVGTFQLLGGKFIGHLFDIS